MLNYAVDPALLASRVPPGTELDRFDGQTFVSLVGFRFLRTRVLGVRVPFHETFDEVNLRFYVRRRGPDGWRRGVVFVREFVPSPAIALVARVVFNENYATATMTDEVQDTGDGALRTVNVAYRWRRRTGAGAIALRAHGDPTLPREGSLEELITQHYWGYVLDRRGGTLEYGVRHDPWRVWPGNLAKFSGDGATFYGADLARALNVAPQSSFLAEGSPIQVLSAQKIA
jgi:uncharacterized protein